MVEGGAGRSSVLAAGGQYPEDFQMIGQLAGPGTAPATPVGWSCLRQCSCDLCPCMPSAVRPKFDRHSSNCYHCGGTSYLQTQTLNLCMGVLGTWCDSSWVSSTLTKRCARHCCRVTTARTMPGGSSPASRTMLSTMTATSRGSSLTGSGTPGMTCHSGATDGTRCHTCSTSSTKSE